MQIPGDMRSAVLLVASIPIVAVCVGCAARGSDPPAGPSAPGNGETPGAPAGMTPGIPGAGGTATGDLPCDVDAVLESHCRQCHGATPSYGAPMPLVTRADLLAPSRSDPATPVFQKVVARVQDDGKPMPPSPNARLTTAERATLDQWAARGALSGDTSCTTQPDAGTPTKPLSCTPDTFIRGGAPFTMPPNTTDIYMCYGFDVSPATKRHVIGFAPHIDNKKIVHHLLLFQADASYSPVPQQCTAVGSAAWRLITGWAPGGTNLETPPAAGFPEDASTHWILQVHYNDVSGQNAGQVDQTGYDLCTTDQLRPNDAEVMAFGTLSVSLPPHATTSVACAYDTTLMPAVHLFSASPHMHKLGTAMSTYIAHAGQSTKVVDQPNFSFQSQVSYPVDVDITPGDIVNTTCTWTNTTTSTVTWGEKTTDEMGFDFVGYYPRITSSFWSWTFPSVFASCTSTTQ
jgi:hypothetical protein